MHSAPVGCAWLSTDRRPPTRTRWPTRSPRACTRWAARPIRVRVETFWRDASLRLEYGHTDVESFRHGWVDVAALRRELLEPLGPGGTGVYVAALRDPATNRATRQPRQLAAKNAVLLLSGELLLDQGLVFDRTIHLSMSPSARRRHTPPEQGWTLEAHDEYDAECHPDDRADIIVRLNDPRHPAIGIRPPRDERGVAPH